MPPGGKSRQELERAEQDRRLKEAEALRRRVAPSAITRATPGADQVQAAGSAKETRTERIVRRLHYGIRTPTNRLTMADQMNQVAPVAPSQTDGSASSRAPGALVPENPMMDSSIAQSGIPSEDADNIPVDHQTTMTRRVIEPANSSVVGLAPNALTDRSLAPLSNNVVGTQYTPYPPAPELPVAGAPVVDNMTAALSELPMPGVATTDIPNSDVASAIQLGIRESTRETRRQVREECRAIAEEFQENVRLAMREQLQAFDDRYAHRSEVQEFRAEVRHLASTIERMQLGRQIAPCTRLGVADNPITALPFTPGGNSIPASHAIPALSQNAMHSYVPGPSAETPNETPDDGQYSWQGPSRYHGGHEFQPEPYSRIGYTAQSEITRSVADPAMQHASLHAP